jgi:voltage-gated potassium channel
VYWAIVTLTTVGYGDIAPQTPVGQALASIVMITGYAIIAVPTGIVTSEITRLSHEMRERIPRRCPECDRGGHDENATYCNHCGTAL